MLLFLGHADIGRCLLLRSSLLLARAFLSGSKVVSSSFSLEVAVVNSSYEAQ
jgi:hypothetical protein